MPLTTRPHTHTHTHTHSHTNSVHIVLLGRELGMLEFNHFPMGAKKGSEIRPRDKEMVRRRKGKRIPPSALNQNQNSQKISVGEDSRPWGEGVSGLVIALVLGCLFPAHRPRHAYPEWEQRTRSNLASADTLAPSGESPFLSNF